MNRLKSELINAINSFDDSNPESFYALRNIVCEVSDKMDLNSRSLFIDHLLSIASTKMRVFGYNIMNNFNVIYKEENSLDSIEGKLVKSVYTEQSGTLLDINQKRVLDQYSVLKFRRIILSAPTSFGKTRLLQEIIYKYRYKKILLLFPTNALLFENQREIIRFNSEHNLGYKIFTNTNIDGVLDENAIFLLTPERYLKLKLIFPNIKIDFFFMDEVYKIDNFFEKDINENLDEDDRDKVFRVVLYQLSKTVRDYYLVGPYVNLRLVKIGLQRYLDKFNVLEIQVDDELVVKKIFRCSEGDVINLGGLIVRIYKGNRPKTTVMMLKAINESFLGSTLIYCANKRTIDSLSQKVIYSNFLQKNHSERHKQFVNHLSHRYGYYDEGIKIEWSIKRYLENGISVHYGSLPKYIQIELLNLFNEGDTNVIFSTTSITEGVNTNAKNLIFFGDSKGKKDLKVFDVKNIVGRAGRYYHHFVGNIYMFDDKIIEMNQSSESEPLDFVTFSDEEISVVDIDNTNIEDLMDRNKQVKAQRTDLLNSYNIPNSVYEENRTIDWLLQANLFELINSKNNEELTLFVNEMSSVSNFIHKDKNNLNYIFKDLFTAGLVEEHEMLRYPSIAKSHSHSGFQGLLDYEVKIKKKKKLELGNSPVLALSEYDTCYRSVFSNMQNVIEYRVPKMLNVYSSLLKYVCSLRGVQLSQEAIDSIIGYYETGLFSKVGHFLSGRGFPHITIKMMERLHQYEMNENIEVFKMKLQNNSLSLLSNLDEYEKRLLQEILNR